jgi:uncharacterized membrane protein YhaH (DUF805 family)
MARYLQLLFGFRGRICRTQYWAGNVLVGAGLLTLFAVVVAPVLNAHSPAAALGEIRRVAPVLAPVSTLTLWMRFALQVKRFHDRGRTGWFALVGLLPWFAMGWVAERLSHAGAGAVTEVYHVLPVILAATLFSAAILAELGGRPGTSGDNRFGPPPGSPAASRQNHRALDFETADAAIQRALEERRKSSASSGRPAVQAAAQVTAGFGRRGLRP